MLVAIGTQLTPFASQGALAKEGAGVCGTGPYNFTHDEAGVIPSIRKQVAGLGLMAKIAGCPSFEVTCGIRPSIDDTDRKIAKKEAQTRCNAVKAALLLNMRSSNTVAAKASRDAVKVITKPASSNLAMGVALVRVGAVASQ